jgi:pimeloyl-ACP methyl ester carboxylesterase
MDIAHKALAVSMQTECASPDGVRFLEIDVDVTAAAQLGEKVSSRVTIALPNTTVLLDPPIVCFALPGATYSRKYFTFDMPEAHHGGEAGWHALRGWIFVAIDHLGVGESSLPNPAKLVYNNVAAANHATCREVLQRLASGSLLDGFPAITNPLVLGIGHSMGGCLTVVQQARHNTFDAIAVLGFSAIHTYLRGMPGSPRSRFTNYIPRDNAPIGVDYAIPEIRDVLSVNSVMLELIQNPSLYPNPMQSSLQWSFHFDDEPTAMVERDMDVENPPPWRSGTMPGLVLWVATPGTIAAEAASIVAPVLAAFGERDILDDPRLESKAYRCATDFSVFICPRMAHMHNFATTREILWTRIHTWAAHVAALKQLLPSRWPSQLFSDSY